MQLLLNYLARNLLRPAKPGIYSLSSSASMAASEAKKQCVRIGTHSGTFHCDEALACWMLMRTNKFKHAQIVRTRDQSVLKDLDAVVDVGGVYDPSSLRFDHHQKEFSQDFGHGFVTKLSSAGLVYKHFGKEVISSLLDIPQDDPNLNTVFLAVYKRFMEAVDAVDNGINQWEGDSPPKYACNTSLSSRVSYLNPAWNEDSSEERQFEKFMEAVKLTGTEFADAVNFVGKSWLPARKHVVEALESRLQIDPSGSIIKLNHYCPWKLHLYELEEEMNLEPHILYCLYEDGQEKKWRIQAVSVSNGSFKSRKPLPMEWRGIRDKELDEITGIDGCVFVHASGFIGGNATYAGALKMAQKALTLK